MPKAKILIVDDDTALSASLRKALEQNGPYEIAVENDPRRAKFKAQDFKPDLILMDVIMPWMDGGTAAGEIRQDENLKNIPVIFLTSILGKDEAEKKGGRIGNDPVLAKPVSIDDLIRMIRKHLPQNFDTTRKGSR